MRSSDTWSPTAARSTSARTVGAISSRTAHTNGIRSRRGMSEISDPESMIVLIHIREAIGDERREWKMINDSTFINSGPPRWMVLFGLWIARGHLRAVFRKAFTGDASVDDSGEIMSYRTAV